MKSEDLSALGLASALPTRIITYAWGEKYLDILLSLTIPALLAPGNLPYVAASTSCELVILTEERFFAAVGVHPSIIRARQSCPVRLIALDDLITQKDKYGMALTYALHRGFSDLGPAMTESWQIFLNADFVLAEGSLRTVVSRLAQGERLVAGPSYCVNASAVVPELRERIRKDTGDLSIPPRELASIALSNRHNTIRGKTINQSEFNLRYMDQFYWLVDDSTLLGHQMPIAIMGMRPERHVIEPSSYWDHGLMKEYCPDAELCVLGDSDQFLMIELREGDVAQELIERGWPQPKEIAERMITFLTPYQRDSARHPLTLHSGEIPSETATARTRLRAYVNEVHSHLPVFLASHIDHPQWNYHRPGFVELRHKLLSERLGSLTEALPSPGLLSKLDQAWWRFDGMMKHVSRRRTELRDFVDGELRLLHEAANDLERAGDVPDPAARGEFDRKLAAIRSRVALQHPAIAKKLDKYFSRERLAPIGIGTLYLHHLPSLHALDAHRPELHAKHPHEYRRQANETAKDLSELYQLGAQLFDLELEVPRNEYRVLIPRRIASAAIPYVKTEEAPGTGASTKNLLGSAYRALLGQIARNTMKPFTEILAGAVANGASRVLCIGSVSGLTTSTVNRLTGYHVEVSTAGMMTGNFAKAFQTPPKFDVCVCDLDLAELLEFPALVATVRPFMAARGIIVGFHLNRNLSVLPNDLVLHAGLSAEDVARIHRTGSRMSAYLLGSLRNFEYLYASREYPKLLTFTVRSAVRIGALALVTPIVFLTRRLRSLQRRTSIAMADTSTSIMIEIAIASNN